MRHLIILIWSSLKVFVSDNAMKFVVACLGWLWRFSDRSAGEWLARRMDVGECA